jgi:hypothetical protein
MGLAELEKEQDWLLRLLPRRYLRLNHTGKWQEKDVGKRMGAERFRKLLRTH